MQHFITTPEQVEFKYQISGLASRSLAWIIDQIFLMLLRIGIVYAAGPATFLLGAAPIILLIFLVDFGYFLLFELLKSGQTPGKQLLAIRVISADGSKLSFSDILVRNLIRPLDTLPFGMLIGGIVSLFDPESRRIGDMAAGTVVVTNPVKAIPEAYTAKITRDNSFQEDSALRTRINSRATREERDILLDLMLRRDEFAVAVREELFEKMAKYIRAKYSIPDTFKELSDEQTCINAALILSHKTGI